MTILGRPCRTDRLAGPTRWLAIPVLVLCFASMATANTVEFGTPVPQGGGCVSVPVMLTRSTATAALGAGVTIQLSADLILCDPTPSVSITRGPWLTNWGTSILYFVTSPASGAYQVDQAIAGPPCGPSDSNVLFHVSVKAANASVTSGTISVLEAAMTTCAVPGTPVALSLGAPVNIPFPTGPVDPVTGFSASRLLTGNDRDGTVKLQFNFTLPATATSAEIYCAPFGNHPEYDDPSPLGGTRSINFQHASATPPTGFEHDYGLVYDATRGYGWALTNPTINRNLNIGDATDGFAIAFNSDTPAKWELDLATIPQDVQVRVVCGDPLTQQRAVVNVEGVPFLSNVLTNGAVYTEATQTVTVNDGKLTILIGGTFPNTPPGSHTKLNFVQVIGAGGGPPGSVPPTVTAFPPPTRYTLLGNPATSPALLELPARDYYYCVCYAKNGGGQRSTPVALPWGNGILNYHLGDFYHDTPAPLVPCAGDNLINLSDLSFFAGNYGRVLTTGDPLACLDICPLSTTAPTKGLPVTDNVVDFFDLNCFAANYGAVSKSHDPPALAAVNSLGLEPVELTEAGSVRADLRMQGDGTLRTVAVALRWNPSVVEPVASRSGPMLDAQDGIALEPARGSIDCALRGSRDIGLAGDGVLASVEFRRLRPGDPGLGIESARAIDLSGELTSLIITDPDVAGQSPRTAALLHATPNPFNPSTRIAFAITQRQVVRLSIFALDGRLVRELDRSEREAGTHEVLWDGTDRSGSRVASGVYYARLQTLEGTSSKPLVLVK